MHCKKDKYRSFSEKKTGFPCHRKLLPVICAGLGLILFTGCGSTGDGQPVQDSGANAAIEAVQDTGADAAMEADQAAGDIPEDTSGAADSDVPATDSVDVYHAKMPEGEEVSEIFVGAIDGISDDFIKGMDVSSLLAEEASGVKYYDKDGNEQDLFKLLADAGINCIRVRVWNDPFDAEGHGYGGGNCTAETAAELGRRAAAYDMDLCVDFHYSDFWADPNKQMRPKSWNNMRVKDQKQALYDYTRESLKTIIDAGARVSMVQIGNEINYGLSGRTSFPDIVKLLESGSAAVRDTAAEYGTDIRVCVHYTGIDDPEGIDRIAGRLDEADLDYDIFGISYYPYWHGDMDNLVSVLKGISSDYDVDTCIMETSYMYTSEDGDGSGNSVSEGNAVAGYPISVQGQANCIRDICAAAVEGGALGVFYWEGAWIPVKPESGTREAAWEEFGSGWASSYSAEYDPNDAGKYYGGCSWENQALFDFDGKALPSLDVFKYLKYGAKGDKLRIMELEDISLELHPGDELILPDSISVIWNDPSCSDSLKVEWDQETLDGFDTGIAGSYKIPGLVRTDGFEVYDSIDTDADGNIKIEAVIDIENVNLVQNPSFEDADLSCWRVESSLGPDPTDYQDKSADAHTGDIAFHFWDDSPMEFDISQEITVDRGGTYRADCYIQGGDFKEADTNIYLYVVPESGEFDMSDTVMPDGWVSWKNPEITGIRLEAGEKVTIGVHVTCNANAWATVDDFSLRKD